MSNNVGTPNGWAVDETIVLFNGIPRLSSMSNVIVPALVLGVGVGVGVGLAVAAGVEVGVGVVVGAGVGVWVGAGAGVTVTCVVPWALKYPVFDPLAVIVQFVVMEKLGAVKLVL